MNRVIAEYLLAIMAAAAVHIATVGNADKHTFVAGSLQIVLKCIVYSLDMIVNGFHASVAGSSGSARHVRICIALLTAKRRMLPVGGFSIHRNFAVIILIRFFRCHCIATGMMLLQPAMR